MIEKWIGNDFYWKYIKNITLEKFFKKYFTATLDWNRFYNKNFLAMILWYKYIEMVLL